MMKSYNYSVFQKTVYNSSDQEDEHKVLQHTMTMSEAVKVVHHLTGIERFNAQARSSLDTDFPDREYSYYFEKWDTELDS